MWLLQLFTARFNVVIKTEALLKKILFDHILVLKQCSTPFCFNNSPRVALVRTFEITYLFKLKAKLTLTLSPENHSERKS